MIKKLLALQFVIVFSQLSSQIPNPGFESVTSGKPNGWNLGAYSVYPLRDTNVTFAGSHAAAFYGSTPPAFNGAVTVDFPQSSQRPQALTGYYKFYPQLGDSMIVYAEVWKQGNYAGKAKTTFTTGIFTGTTSVFTQFSVNINYVATSYTNPTCDSAFISIYPTGNVSQGGYNWAHPNTKGIIDDLAWTFTVLAVPEINKNVLLNVENVYPNPAQESLNIIYTISSPTTVNLKLFDITGKEVMSLITNEKQNLGRYKAVADLNAIAPGIYLYEFSTSDGYKTTKKFVKQ